MLPELEDYDYDDCSFQESEAFFAQNTLEDHLQFFNAVSAALNNVLQERAETFRGGLIELQELSFLANEVLRLERLGSELELDNPKLNSRASIRLVAVLENCKSLHAEEVLVDFGVCHNCPEVRQRSLEALESYDSPSATVAILDFGLRDSDYSVFTAAYGALIAQQNPASQRIILEKGLRSNIADIREASAEALNGTTDNEAIEALSKTAAKDIDPKVRAAALRSLRLDESQLKSA